jgi:probable F420-dependent oxidoreductase
MADELPRLGFGLPVSGAWATPATMLRVARRAEELGYASLWTFQRVLSPLADAAARDPAGRAPHDPAYAAVHDAVLPLAYVAGHTERIGLGTATLCAPFTPPALLAKAMASLDHLSGGRLTVGLGMGWLPEEYAAAGVPFARRGARLEEYLRCLHALWTQDPVEHTGEFYTVPRSRLGVRPLQRPHPPVLLGGAAPAALRRAGRLAQGWIVGSGTDPDEIAASVELVRAGAREAGRDPGALRVLARVVLGERPDLPRVLDDLARLRARGVTEAFVDLNFSPHAGDAADDEAERVLVALAPGRAQPSCPSRPRPSA